jgi:hypothetical protein
MARAKARIVSSSSIRVSAFMLYKPDRNPAREREEDRGLGSEREKKK